MDTAQQVTPAETPALLSELIAPETIARAAEYRHAFETAEPFPHVAIDGFLEARFARSLVDQFPPIDEAYERNCIGEDGRVGPNYSNADPASFPPAFKTLDRLIQHPGFLSFVSELTGIPALRYDGDYFGGGIRESAAGFLPPHIDFNHHPRELTHRRLNLLLYLNEGWDERWGGNIQVHRDPRVHEDSLVRGYSPEFNRCFLFETSEISWHAFDRLAPPPGVRRRAFTIYYYTAERPGAEHVTIHNTEYVEPPLPPHLVPGHTLTEQDVALLREGYSRRDGRIEMLYALRRDADGKYANLWKEYEYYLNAWREATGR